MKEKTESCGTGAGYMSAVENSKIANEKEEKKRKKKAKLESFTKYLGKYLSELKYDGVSRLTGEPHYPDGARSAALKIKDTLTKKAFNNKMSNKQYVLKREKIKSVEDKVVHDMVTDFVTKY